MPNEEADIVEAENNETEVEVEDTKEETVEEKPKVEKPKRTPEEELKYLEGRTKRLRKDLGLETPEKPEQKSETPKTGELDDTQLDYLDLKGITEDEDIAVIKKVMKNTGQTLRETLKDDYVVTKLKENKTARDVKTATPSSTKRSGQQASDNEDYYYQKYMSTGELPKNLPKGMAAKLVNRRAAEEDPHRNPFE